MKEVRKYNMDEKQPGILKDFVESSGETYKMFSVASNKLEEKGLMKRMNVSANSVALALTEKGHKFLDLYMELENMIEDD